MQASLAHKAQAAYEMRHRQQLQAEIRTQTTLDRQQRGMPPMADHQHNDAAQRLPTAGKQAALVAQLEELRSQHAASEAALAQQQGVVLRLRGDVQEAASEMLLLRVGVLVKSLRFLAASSR